MSCVEQSRWSYRSDKFSAGRQASASLRGKLHRTVRRSVRESGEYDSDQGMVWNEVARMHCSLGTSSDTGAMSDAYTGVEEQLNYFSRNIMYPSGALGMAVLINGKLSAVETFSHPIMMEKLWEAKVQSYGMDAILAGQKKARVGSTYRTSVKQYEEFLRKITKGLEPPVKAPGVGYDIGIEGKEVAGAACLDGGKLIYMSAFVDKISEKTRGKN